MNKFLILVLAIILVATSAFRLKNKEDTQQPPSEEDVQDIIDKCTSCKEQQSELTAEQLEQCREHHDDCQALFDMLNSHNQE